MKVKKIIASLCVCSLLVSSSINGQIVYGEETNSSENSAIEETENNIEIYTADDFLNISQDMDADYILMNDLDFTRIQITDQYLIPGEFAGSLDGNGHKIKGFTKSLFYSVTEEGHIEDISAEVNLTDSFKGMIYVNNGTVENCEVTLSMNEETKEKLTIAGVCYVNNGSVLNCKSYGNCTIKSGNVVGIAYYNYGMLSECVNNMNINILGASITTYIESIYIAGISRENSSLGKIENCVNYGNFSVETNKNISVTEVGGILAVAGGYLNSCKNYGDIDFKGESFGYIGGICGSASCSRMIMLDCHHYGEIISEGAQARAAAIIGNLSFRVGIFDANDELQYFDYMTVYLENCTNEGNVTNQRDIYGKIVGRIYLGKETSVLILKNCSDKDNANITSEEGEEIKVINNDNKIFNNHYVTADVNEKINLFSTKDDIHIVGNHAIEYEKEGTNITFLYSGIEQYIAYTDDSADYCRFNIADIPVTWTFEDGVLSIHGTGKMPVATEDEPMWRIYKDETRKIVFDRGITEISDYAFYEFENLETVEFPNTLKYIRVWAFMMCKKLGNVTLPEGVIRLDERCFAYCDGIENFTIPASVTFVSYWILEHCENLKTIYIDANENQNSKQIYPILAQCPKLESVRVSPYLKSHTVIDNVLYEVVQDRTLVYESWGEYIIEPGQLILISYPSTKKDETFETPSNMVSVAPLAFAYINYLKKLVINEGCLKIGKVFAFSAEELVLPSTLLKFDNENSLEALQKITNNSDTDISFYSEDQFKSLDTGEIVDKISAHGTYVRETNERIYVIKQPENQCDEAEKNVKLETETIGLQVSYQWEYKDSDGQWKESKDEGYNTKILNLSITEDIPEEGRTYRCKISNENGVVMYTENAVVSALTAIKLKTESNYKINQIDEMGQKEKIISGILEEQSCKQFTENIEHGEKVIVRDKLGNEKTLEDSICTGDVIELISDNGDIIDTAYAVIKGDVNGDGMINVTDMEEIQKSILGLAEVKGIYAYAGHLATEKGQAVSVMDMEAIQKHILGIE